MVSRSRLDELAGLFSDTGVFIFVTRAPNARVESAGLSSRTIQQDHSEAVSWTKSLDLEERKYGEESRSKSWWRKRFNKVSTMPLARAPGLAFDAADD